MNNRTLSIVNLISIVIFTVSCNMIGGGNSGNSSQPSDGQLHGVPVSKSQTSIKPYGMVYVPGGMFHMGPSDEDINFTYTSRNKAVSMSGFWMDQTEITNAEYKQFTNWVRDSIAAKLLGYVKQGKDGIERIDRKKVIKWSDKATIEKIDAIIVTPDNRIFGKKEIDPNKIIYHSEVLDYKAAAQNRDQSIPRSAFIVKTEVKVYPDTLVWVRDFAYSYNEPMAISYFSHPAYANYPVVGVNWKQATAFCQWRTHIFNVYLESKKRTMVPEFRLPTEAQWEYAARGGRSQVQYPWGGPYLRNKKGCALANFKPGRGNYTDDGALYTTRSDAYFPNDFGLYNMAGNVSEWTSSLYTESAGSFQHDINTEIRWNAKDSDPPRMKRKVVKGGSWKDVAFYLQNSSRVYEYQDTAKSYIGFRCVQDLPPSGRRR